MWQAGQSSFLKCDQITDGLMDLSLPDVAEKYKEAAKVFIDLNIYYIILYNLELYR